MQTVKNTTESSGAIFKTWWNKVEKKDDVQASLDPHRTLHTFSSCASILGCKHIIHMYAFCLNEKVPNKHFSHVFTPPKQLCCAMITSPSETTRGSKFWPIFHFTIMKMLAPILTNFIDFFFFKCLLFACAFFKPRSFKTFELSKLLKWF